MSSHARTPGQDPVQVLEGAIRAAAGREQAILRDARYAILEDRKSLSYRLCPLCVAIIRFRGEPDACPICQAPAWELVEVPVEDVE